MTAFQKIAAPAVLWISTLVPLAGGCCCWEAKTPTPPLGTQSDAIWRRQEAGAAASEFVMYQSEFQQDGAHLNMAGEDHLKSIAARLHAGAPLPVIVERSTTSEREDSEYHYPVNGNFELDKKRREAIVGYLVAMGIPNADQCVVVATPLAQGYTATQAVRAYNRGLVEPAAGFGGRGTINFPNTFGGGFGGGGGGGTIGTRESIETSIIQ